jgi:membrane protease YdiL (CAAX protease family)
LKLVAVLLLALLVSAPVAAASEPPAPPTVEDAPRKPLMPGLLWSLLPGGGHFYAGEPGAGLTYAVGTVGLLAAGVEVGRRNDRLGRDDEVNIPWAVGGKLWEYSMFSGFRSTLHHHGVDLRALGMDDTPTSRLLLAPFTPEHFLHPSVWGAGLLGAVGGALGGYDAKRRIGDVSRVEMFGSDYSRDRGSTYYGLSAFSLSMGAAMSEEALFRGVLQPFLQDRWGERGGLWATAGAFGLAHIVAPDGSFNPGGVLFATGAGAYLGWLYNASDNRLARPVAAHFWYNFMLFTVSWIMDPDDNPLGVGVQFEF